MCDECPMSGSVKSLVLSSLSINLDRELKYSIIPLLLPHYIQYL